MVLLLSIVTGVLFACGLYSLLRRSMVRILLGLMLLSHAANLAVFTAGGLVRARPPLVEAGSSLPVPGHADPLPQALVLTAIVIGFALVAFAAVLITQTSRSVTSDDAESLGEE